MGRGMGHVGLSLGNRSRCHRVDNEHRFCLQPREHRMAFLPFLGSSGRASFHRRWFTAGLHDGRDERPVLRGFGVPYMENRASTANAVPP